MLKMLLLASMFLLFYSLTVGRFPDTHRIKDMVVRYVLPAGSALLFFAAVTALLRTPAAGLFWAVLGWFIPSWVIRASEEKKRSRLRNMTKDFVTSAAGLYAAGQMTPEVVKVMAERFPEPFASEFQNMVNMRNMSPYASFPRMFERLANKYGLSEFKAVSAIVAASERAGGPVAASKGLKRLGRALRQRDRLIKERAKATMEPRTAVVVAIVFLSVGFLLDATVFREMFEGAGKLIMVASSALLVGLIFMVNKITRSEDLA